MFEYSSTKSLFERDDEERQVALQYLAEAWRNADVEGVEKEALAHFSGAIWRRTHREIVRKTAWPS